MKTTLADIAIAAHTSAVKAFTPNADGTAKDQLAIESLRLEEFSGTGFDRADYPTWEQSFNSVYTNLKALATQPSPATVAANKAAAAAAQAAVKPAAT